MPNTVSAEIKNAFDRMGAGGAIVVTSPILIAAAVAIRLEGAGPVLFTQARIGRNGRTFRVHKLRTMRTENDASGRPLPDAQRITRLGQFLRASSIDELPQLWNVLRGEMSLVGPRPLLPQYLDRYTRFQARRHEVLPGITGWAQVNGRNALSWSEKLDLDVWYVDHWSLALDAKILLRTVAKVLKPAGISNEGSATMPEFMGSGGP